MLLLGRVTYEGFAALDKVEWQNSHLIAGDVVEAVSALKRKDCQNILVGGSGVLADTLLQAGLVDELRFLVSPVVLGSGRRFFKEGSPRSHGARRARDVRLGRARAHLPTAT